MNIYTFKLTKAHIAAAILGLAAILALIILLVPGRSAATSAEGKITVKTRSDCVSYLQSLGYDVDEDTAECKKVIIPKTFDAVYENYNCMQKECGFDLSRYCGKKVELTTFRVKNYPADEDVLADVLVYRNRVIGGAVYTAAVDGFMTGLQPLSQKEH